MYDNMPDENKPVADWTLDECSDYVAMADECEGEQRAEYGSGAVSLGYDGSEAMMYYDGFRASDDRNYVEAAARLAADRALRLPVVPVAADLGDDIPF